MSKTGPAKRRRALLVVLLAVAALVGCCAIRVALFVSGKPTISINYAGPYNERLRPAGLAPGDNAAPCYKDAFARLPAMPDDVRRVGSLWKYEPASIEWRVVESWLTAGEEALRLVQQAARKPDFWADLSTINYDDPAFVEEMGFDGFHQAMLGLRYKAQYLAVKGNLREAFDCVLAMYRMARHMGGRGRMQINLAQALEGLANRTAFDLLSETDVDSSLLNEFQRQLEQVLSQRKPPSFEGDEILLRDAIQRYFTDDGNADGHLIARAVYDHHRRSDTPANELAANAAYLGSLHTAWVHPSRQRTTRTLTFLVESASQLIRKPLWELHNGSVDPADQLAGIVKGNHFLQMVSADGTLARTIQAYHEIGASHEALISTMAILRFRKDKGTWPPGLEELAAAGYIRRVPIDPYSGRPLVYRQTAGAFILYSWGQDFDDDGGTGGNWGRPPQGGDQVFSPTGGHTK